MKNFRNSFTDDDFSKKSLPEGHREEFLNKLESVGQLPAKKKNRTWMKFAAAIAVMVGLGFVLLQNRETDEFPKTKTIALQLQKVEKQYLKEIETEWENFLKLTKDPKLIARYKKKLTQLDTDYNEISTSYQANKNNLLVVEDLIRNLQTRLILLQEIQEHIKILNQKNEQYETVI